MLIINPRIESIELPTSNIYLVFAFSDIEGDPVFECLQVGRDRKSAEVKAFNKLLEMRSAANYDVEVKLYTISINDTLLRLAATMVPGKPKQP